MIGCAIEVHRELGPGLLEMMYEECLADELGRHGLPFERQVKTPVIYKGRQLGTRYRLDLIVQRVVVVEIKAVETLLPVHKAQVLTQLRITDLPLGLLINFNGVTLIDGVRRVIHQPRKTIPVL
ncbi:MAG: GxxExxY protein [Gemmatimonadota bacterium]